MAEPRVARARRRQARRRRAAAAPRAGAAGRTCVASYWQRYCSKNDTIGFFGPLAWGSFGRRASRSPCARARWSASASCTSRRGRSRPWRRRPASARRCRWAPFPERALPRCWPTRPGLDRLERARDAVAAAPREQVAAALDAARPRVRGGHRPRRRARRRATAAAGARSPTSTACATSTSRSARRCSTSCARSLPLVLAASRWWCGRVFDRGAELLGRDRARPRARSRRCSAS